MKRVRSTKQSRRSAREEVGRLGPRLLAPATLKLYLQAIQLFLLWLTCESIVWPEDADDLDELLQTYAEHCWAEGDSKADYANLLSGISHPVTGIARIAKYIKGAWKFYGLWVKLEQRERCLPLSSSTCRMLAGQSIKRGWYDMAFVILLAHHCLLRTQEFCECRSGDFKVSGLGHRAVLHLPDTKSGKRTHKEESVTVTDKKLVAFGQALQQSLQPGDRFLSMKASAFRKQFRVLLKDLEMDHLYIQPYSLRRGGATEHFLAGNSLHRTCLRGRWSSTATARIYMNEARQDPGDFQTPDTAKTRAAVQALLSFFE